MMQTISGGMSRTDLIDEYFIENRTKLLDLAAFMDRVDRTASDGQPEDYRLAAFREAVAALTVGPGRVSAIQMIFSDPTTEPLEALDQKSARGAFDPRGRATK